MMLANKNYEQSTRNANDPMVVRPTKDLVMLMSVSFWKDPGFCKDPVLVISFGREKEWCVRKLLFFGDTSLLRVMCHYQNYWEHVLSEFSNWRVNTEFASACFRIREHSCAPDTRRDTVLLMTFYIPLDNLFFAYLCECGIRQITFFMLHVTDVTYSCIHVGVDGRRWSRQQGLIILTPAHPDHIMYLLEPISERGMYLANISQYPKSKKYVSQSEASSRGKRGGAVGERGAHHSKRRPKKAESSGRGLLLLPMPATDLWCDSADFLPKTSRALLAAALTAHCTSICVISR